MGFAMLIKYKDRKFEKEIDELMTEFNFTKDVQENGEVFYRTGGKDGFSNMGILYLRLKNLKYYKDFEKWDWYKDGKHNEDMLSHVYEIERLGEYNV